MRVIRRQKSGYALSLILGLMGIIALWVTMRRVWPQISVASDPLSTFVQLLWTETLDFPPYVEFRLLYLVILGGALLAVGGVVAVLSTQRVFLPGKVVWYHCPFCKKEWRASGDRGLVHCPICRQLVHPTIVEK
jgi:hypothetical protein